MLRGPATALLAAAVLGSMAACPARAGSADAALSVPAAPLLTGTAAARPSTDSIALVEQTAATLSEAATRLASAAAVDARFLGQALDQLEPAVAAPTREKTELLLAEEEDIVKGFRGLADGLVELARTYARLGGNVSAAQKSLDDTRASAQRHLQQILQSRASVERVVEDSRLARLEVEGARQRASAAQSAADRALAAHRKARADAAALSSPLGQLGNLMKRALAVSVPTGQAGSDWIAAYIDRRRKALEEFRTALVQEREARGKIELDVAYRGLEVARLELEQREAAAAVLDEALQTVRKQLGVTADEVRKAEAAARQAQAEAQTQKAAAVRTAEQAREEKDAAATAEARLRQRQQDLERERAAQPAGTDPSKLDARAQVLDAEARWAEDRRSLAGEREQLAALETELARAKERIANEQSTAMRRIFEAVREALANPDRTVPIELQYRAAKAGLESTDQETHNLQTADAAVRSARGAIVERVSLLVERVAKDKSQPADETRGALLRTWQDDHRTMLERQRVADSMLAVQTALRKVQADRAKFFSDSLTTLSHYRRESETKVTTVSLMEGWEALRDASLRGAAVAAAAPGELQLYVSRPGNRWRLARGLLLILLLFGAAAALATAARRAGVGLMESPSATARAAVELGLDTVGPLLCFSAARLALQLLAPGDRQLTAVLADPFLFVVGYRALRWPIRRWGARLTGSTEARWCFVCSALAWTVWVLRYALVFAILEHALGRLGTSRTLLFLASAARNVGILAMVLAFLTFERKPLAHALQLPPEGEFPQLRRWYNHAVLRIYTGILVFFAIVGGLWLAGYRERADWLLRSTTVSLAIFAAGTAAQWGAVSWIRRHVHPDPAVLPPWWRSWLETAVRLLLGVVAILLIADAWSVEVRFLYGIFFSPLVRDAAARAATVLVIALAARFAVDAFRFLIYRVFTIGTVIGSAEPLLSRRGMTLAPLLTSVVRYTVYFIAAVFILRTVGLDPTPLVAGAGVLGLAVGFGAQSLVKDVITGFFIITEDLISVGDIVELDSRIGQVEEITVRVTKLRLYSGELRIIPNSEIRQIGNQSRGFMRALVPVTLPASARLDEAMRLLEDVALQYYEAHRESMLSEPEVQGVLALGRQELQLRAVVKVRPADVAEIERGLRAAFKRALEERGVPPYGHKRRSQERETTRLIPAGPSVPNSSPPPEGDGRE
ncbi:MAG: mechanosensitive ion channel [Candidatus Wallbacteria bacterium]|nr:mechanosensitive ion channel [Candidatus Wallbacteria bacterium]